MKSNKISLVCIIENMKTFLETFKRNADIIYFLSSIKVW